MVKTRVQGRDLPEGHPDFGRSGVRDYNWQIQSATIDDADGFMGGEEDPKVTLHGPDGATKTVSLKAFVGGVNLTAESFVPEQTAQEMQDEFDGLSKEEQIDRVRATIEGRHNVTLDNEEIRGIIAGGSIQIQPAPRDLIDHFGKDEHGVQMLNAFTSWVTGAAPFSSQAGLWDTIGSFAGSAAMGFAGAAGGGVGKKIAEG